MSEVRTAPHAGDRIPALHLRPGPVQMFQFSAAVSNPHRIHYDRRWAIETEGYPDIVVQGHMQAALLARAVTDWAGPRGRLVRFAMQNRGAAFADEALRFEGVVSAVSEAEGETVVELDLVAMKEDGTVLGPGTATVTIRDRGAHEGVDKWG
ncbi:hypothetical protein ABZS66_54635 [Dactylosporangium sp. NPDC005572]|uniref:hypothetical protein n=1 Tax=Dactylosporangium sp. NPDC005572 TaxID=3156889 RepID=UPI0033BAED6F